MRRKREETTRHYVSREKRSLMEENIRPIFFVRPFTFTRNYPAAVVYLIFRFSIFARRKQKKKKKTLENRRNNDRIRF